MNKKLIAVAIILLFGVSSATSISIKNTKRTADKKMTDEACILDYYTKYNASELFCMKRCLFRNHNLKDFKSNELAASENTINSDESDKKLSTHEASDGLMDSPWPMYCHDLRHTGRSQYSTADNHGVVKWMFNCDNWIEAGIAIGNDDTLYFGVYDNYFYALYPNGTMKWKLYVGGWTGTTPAVDENGVIYFGTLYSATGLYAVYSNGTLKWKYPTPGRIYSSPAIGEDGTIYFGSKTLGGTGYFYALYPNGTLRWRYLLPTYYVISSPAISKDGTVYFGAHDGNLYAFYPQNGTIKWMFKTGGAIRVSPCIADDGTIYCVSFDGHLYAIHQNGTLRWRTCMNNAGTSPTIGHDGTIYAGWKKLFAFYPNNGTIKWTFRLDDANLFERIEGGTPCHSADGTIYFGTSIGDDGGGRLYAVNSNGTKKWKIGLKARWIESAPTIGRDGTVYIGASDYLHIGGHLYAIGPQESNKPPDPPTINGPTSGKYGIEYEYTFTATDPDNNPVRFYVNWSDGTITDWMSGEYPSNVKIKHMWSKRGLYIIKAKAKDTFGYESDWSILEVSMPKNKAINTIPLFPRFLQQHPNLFPILRHLLGL